MSREDNQFAPRPSDDTGVRNLDSVLSVDDVAKFLKVDRKTVYAAIEAGELPGKRIGKRRLVVLKPALVQWLRS